MPLTRNATNGINPETLQPMKQFAREGKNKGAYSIFLRPHRIARVSTMMMSAYHNTCSPAADRLPAPGTEVMPKMKLLKEDLTVQVLGCRLSAASLQDSAGSDGILICMRCALLKSLSYQVKEPNKIMLEGVNGRKSTSSSWRLVRGQPEATFECVAGGNTCDFHQQKEGSFYYCTHATGGHLQQGKKNQVPLGMQLIHMLKRWH